MSEHKGRARWVDGGAAESLDTEIDGFLSLRRLGELGGFELELGDAFLSGEFFQSLVACKFAVLSIGPSEQQEHDAAKECGCHDLRER